MAFQVIFRPCALADIEGAVMWLAQKNPQAAARWRIGLFQIIQNLETNPNRFAEAEESADLGLDLRELLYGRRRGIYRILFTIDGDTVNILRVRHASQDRLSAEEL
jgi:plasmid stabilization system protein ParE